MNLLIELDFFFWGEVSADRFVGGSQAMGRVEPTGFDWREGLLTIAEPPDAGIEVNRL